MADLLIDEYLNNLAGQNPRSVVIVRYDLNDFERSANRTMQMTMIQLVTALKDKQLDVYAILQKYVGELNDHLYQTGKNTAKTINYKVKYAKRLLEYHDVEITQSKFRIKVKMPRNVDPELTPLDKEMARKILNACDDIQLKTFVLWLASSGWRAKESLALKLENINFDTNPSTVSIHGRHTMTRKSRHTWLTQEFAKQLNDYLNWKYRPRRINAYHRGSKGEYVTKLVIPKRRPSDYAFLIYHDDEMKDHARKLEYAYNQLNERFNGVIKRLQIGKEIDSRRSKVTFHSFRRFVYTQLDSLGLGQFAEFCIGHKVSEYWNKPESEKIEIFRKIEPYMTFMDMALLEAKGADMRTKLEQNDEQVRVMREQLGTLFQVMAIEDPTERQKKLAEAAKSNRYYRAPKTTTATTAFLTPD